MVKKYVTIDGNYAASYIAYAFSDVAAIYPITPSSDMGQNADAWAAIEKKNLFGEVVKVVEMQSEGGAAGAVHGSLTAGALTTTFTASQGLLLMIPNMYKISGEMLPSVFHVSARTLATHALSIFCDHSDVMGCRMTGWAMTAASSVQETMDMAVVAHLATLEAKLPFLAFFDGFRTSHEVQKVELIEHDTLKSLLNEEHIREFRSKALKPENPYIKVGAQNPDVFFQGREAANKYYDAIPAIVQKTMDKLAEKTGRKLDLFEYYGAEDAEKVIIIMGSGAGAVKDTIDYLLTKGEKVGLINVHLYRPFAIDYFLKAMPKTVKKIAVLDRTKEPGAIGEPLYMDVRLAITDQNIKIYGGRYGLSSKEFTPSHVKAVYDFLDSKDVFHNFTVGINDDVTHLSIPVNESINTDPEGMTSCMFWGLGSDGTVSANKNSIKIIGDNTDMFAQGYFSYDSKKSGGITISHLRFGKKEIRSPYLIEEPNFIACHNASYIGRYDLLAGIKENGTFLLNSSFSPDEVFNNLTKEMQETILKKNIKVYNIDASKIAGELGLGGRINTVMQSAFFKLANVIPIDDAIKYMKDAIDKTFRKKGAKVVEMNWNAIDGSLNAIEEVIIPAQISVSAPELEVLRGEHQTENWIKDVVEPIVRLKGDNIPVSKMTLDGSMPLSVTRMEKRRIASDVVNWLPESCIQCNQCVIACPHAAIRAKQVGPGEMSLAPDSFETLDIRNSDNKYKIQVYTEDCTGCGVCVAVCPGKKNVKALEFSPLEKEIADGEIINQEFFDSIPENIEGVNINTVKGSQFKTPLFEFSGACAGCGETPYIKLATQLFGDRMMIANATGCSSIYGGTFPSSPYTTNEEGFGPAWANSLFEDNAEYGMGMRLALDSNRRLLFSYIEKILKADVRSELKNALENYLPKKEDVDDEAKHLVKIVKAALPVAIEDAKGEAKDLLMKLDEFKDYLMKKSMWIIGGDGWAYDIGYGGLDHVLASGENVNVLVLDTEVYSNTGGQSSKSSPLGSVAKFAANGKTKGKKDLGLMMMSYGYIYVAHINMGASNNQVVKAFLEAEAYDGPSIIIAYSPCIAHGYDLGKSSEHQQLATDSGYWPIYRYNPLSADQGKNPLVMDTKKLKGSFRDYLMSETRYKTLTGSKPEIAEKLFKAGEKESVEKFEYLMELSKISYTKDEDKDKE
jgi:pyruvate-ferredoxin/flavodoxin oxidoreductase